ncbi:uncharacterized protein LOC107766439 [Nicotiana tabacum]|uniref:Uncharacterized protein LOC107766439 n=1 Tax=Nicotiana tabacum TaxID=4097 RepID=A0AC58RUV0_TOBAC
MGPAGRDSHSKQDNSKYDHRSRDRESSSSSRFGKERNTRETRDGDKGSKAKFGDYNFNVSTSELVAVLRSMGDKVRWPKEMRSNPNRRNPDFWCEFHNDHGHRMADCRLLQGEVDYLLKQGYLTELFSEKGKQAYMKNKQEPPKPPSLKRTVNVISGGEEINGVTYTTAEKVSKVRVTHGKRVRHVLEEESIIFNDADADGILTPHKDALIKAIEEIPDILTSKKEVQRLTGRIAALGRFIFKSLEKCFRSFSALKKQDQFKWSEECQQTLKNLKVYLSNPLLLAKSKDGEKLLIYLVVSELAVSVVLVREDQACLVKPPGPAVVVAVIPLPSPHAQRRLSNAIPGVSQQLHHVQTNPMATARPVEQHLLPLLRAPAMSEQASTTQAQAQSVKLRLSDATTVRPVDVFRRRVILVEIVSNFNVFRFKLVVNQMLGTYTAREARMQQYLKKAHDLVRQFQTWKVVQIPREENVEADALANLASAAEVTNDENDSLIHLFHSVLDQDKNEYGIVLEDKKQAQALRKKVARYCLNQGNLYRKIFGGSLARCLEPSQTEYVMIEIHEGHCGNHEGGISLVKTMIRAGYYWPKMEQDAEKFVAKCDKCQYGNNMHRPTKLLHLVIAPWPFMKWGMDIVGPLPQAKGKVGFLLVLTDYFTKWVETDTFKLVREKEVRDFIWGNIICQFGVPKEIICDNGPQFIGAEITNFFQIWQIKRITSTPYYPVGNGQAESTNKVIINNLKKRLEESKGNWPEVVHGVLWAYRTTTKTSTRETPFSLVYGAEALILVEIGDPRTRYTQAIEESNEEEMRINLDLLEERREAALIRMAAQK